MCIRDRSDSVVPLKETTGFYDKLKEKNIPASLHVYAEEEHAFDGESEKGRSVADLQALFFKKYL